MAKPLNFTLEVDDTFAEAANREKPADEKFRFVNKCRKSGCAQWASGNCGVIKRVLDAMEEKPAPRASQTAACAPSAAGTPGKA